MDRSATPRIFSSPSNLNPESVEDFYQYPHTQVHTTFHQEMSMFDPGAFAGNPVSGFKPGIWWASFFGLRAHYRTSVH